MSEKTCPHCGRSVREGDKFCIFCGKPLLTDFTKTIKESTEKKGSIIFPPQESRVEGKGEQKEEEEDEVKEEVTPFGSGDLTPPEEKQKKKESIPFDVEEDEELLDTLEMEDEMREQFEMKMELAILYGKKDRLKEKLDKILGDAKSERYELDIDFAKEVNMRLEAIKEVQRELQSQIDEVMERLGTFKLDEFLITIEEKRAQLTELKRKFKLGKIKQNIFEQLKREYATEYRKAQEELEKIRKQVRNWISKLKSEINHEEVKKKLLEGRFNTKEIDKETFEKKKEELLRQIEEFKQKIDVLSNYTGE
ncbi:MAG: zinc-ribbon domain-containing protein [Candidatus Lokiarchaeota archaeon]|nr:zinc-ribbon domain-containing protein [Candidatus Lokiarchaeota archaeon]